MARITKSDSAPKDANTFSVGQVTFELSRKNSVYETDDPVVIAGARGQDWLTVEEDEAAADAPVATVTDPYDPHQNPAADHLSVLGSADAIAAATANNDAIREAVGLDYGYVAEAPTVKETVEATFGVIPTDAAPQFPADAEKTAEAPQASSAADTAPAEQDQPATEESN